MRPRVCLALWAVLSMGADACIHHLQDRNPSPPSVTRRSRPGARTKTAISNARVFNGIFIEPPRTVIGRILIPGLIDSHVHVNDVDGLETLTSFGVTTAMLRGHDGLCDVRLAGLPAVGPDTQHAKMFNMSSDQLLYPTADPDAAVSYAFGNKSDFYKITAEKSGLSQDMQTALVKSAHGRGKLAMTHAANALSWKQAVLSGTDGIQHTATDAPIDADVLTQAGAAGQFSTPTMNIARYTFSNPILLEQMGRTPDSPDSYAQVKANVKAIRAAGIPILAGTDAVGTLLPGNLVEATGMEPAEALAAATLVAARHHRLGDRGVVAPGMRADLVLLNSDPLANISNALDIARVWVGGVEYAPVANGKEAVAASPNPSGTVRQK
ncbi:hypothetical protein B0T26DRAFT_739258 [Lasiosphaeria miniovina]|uniref:Amidohydrolase-related domain-containing protein n=1 Tax=Lasiosphaeria miniovina TaxID=1954250 RepID=A0AA40E1V0_9PEZI|nr:uncharacterized protein B0T26DRAFT_739258 [Lasiosphaeria miniovina]KAK0721867.1 hypothetical protein B0T26DRAFT_739258 [Lasiosphaeria miniovina]